MTEAFASMPASASAAFAAVITEAHALSMPRRVVAGPASPCPSTSPLALSTRARQPVPPPSTPRKNSSAIALVFQTLDHRAATAQLDVELLIAAVEVVDAIDDGLAFGGKRRQHQAHRGTQIGCHHLCTLQLGTAAHHGGRALQRDVGAETRQFRHVHETI